LLETQLSKADEWPAFKARFKELNPNYLTNLKKAHPNLSKAEIRLLILIRIGFTQKEIAHILNIAPDSVKKAKNRVRKKMELESTTKLSTYLLQFN
jgi:DNA-binding CsgD family transcriptional regulator